MNEVRRGAADAKAELAGERDISLDAERERRTYRDTLVKGYAGAREAELVYSER